MKMSVATMFSPPGSDFDKVDDALLLLQNVSYTPGNTARSRSNFLISRNENQNNGACSPIASAFDCSLEANLDPESVYSQMIKIRRNGRVSKKSVNRLLSCPLKLVYFRFYIFYIRLFAQFYYFVFLIFSLLALVYQVRAVFPRLPHTTPRLRNVIPIRLLTVDPHQPKTPTKSYRQR